MMILTYINTNIRIALSILSLAFLVETTAAQENREITMEEAVKQATTESWQIRKMVNQVGLARAEHKMTASAFLPSLTVSETFITTTDPLNAFGFKLKQEITTMADFNPEVLNDPDRMTNFNTQIAFTQPIINMDGIYARKAGSEAVHAARYNLEWQKKMAGLQVKDLYARLQMSSEQINMLEKAMKAAESMENQMKDLYEQEMIHEADFMSARLYRTRISQQKSQARYQQVEINNQLAQAMGINEEVTLIPVDASPVPDTASVDASAYDVPMDRPDLLALDHKRAMTETMISLSKGTLLPRLNAFGNYQWNDDTFLGTGANNYLLGVKLEWDLFKGLKNWSGIQKAQFQKEMASLSYEEKMASGKRELEQVKNQLKQAEDSWKLSLLAVQQAEEALQLRKDRYNQGLENTPAVLKAETELLQAQLQELQSRYLIQNLNYRIEILTAS